MSLTNRFSVLFLATVGLILAGFSAALFVSSRIYLDRRVDDRLSAMMTLLSTSIDRKPGWVRWEPRPKRVPPSRWGERHATTWLASDGTGRLLTCPPDFRDENQAQSWARQMGQGTLPDPVKDMRGRSWRVAQARIDRRGGAEPGATRPDDTADGKTYHETVVLAAFASLDESDETLATLGAFLIGISLLVWVLAALRARWLSRTTLIPLTRLVQAARSLDPSNPGWTLAEVGTRDELDDLRLAFNELLARLHEAYERQRGFTSEASHQLRTPVAVMIGHLEVAQRHERTADEYLRGIQLAHRRASAMGQLVQSLLFLNRADSATLIRSETLDLNRWLIECIQSRAESPRSSDFAVECVPNTPLWVNAHPHLLGQLLENLLENACKYSAAGTPIAIATELEAGSAVLSVSDKGRGINREDLSRIFEPFFRSLGSARDRLPGFGLGLSVVQRIVHAFGGSVIVHSEVGQGSRFEVRLPLVVAPETGRQVCALLVPEPVRSS